MSSFRDFTAPANQEQPEESKKQTSSDIRIEVNRNSANSDADSQVARTHVRANGAAKGRSMNWDVRARGEPFIWGFGGALVIGVVMVLGFLVLVVYNGILTFYPQPVQVLNLRDGAVVAGELSRSDTYKPGPEVLDSLPEEIREQIKDRNGFVTRFLYRTGNFDLYNEDFRWIPQYDIVRTETPEDMYFLERMEWGPFIGRIKSADLAGKILTVNKETLKKLQEEHRAAAERRDRIHDIERNEIGAVNHYMDEERLRLRKAEMQYSGESPQYRKAEQRFKDASAKLDAEYKDLSREASVIKETDSKYTITLADINGKEKTLKLSEIVRLYPANALTFLQKVGIYFSRWWEFVSENPREANTEGGVLPAIFGTLCMTVIMALAVSPFGVVAALYLREYAKQGRLVSLVRICVNNLAGVPSIVYGVFGLGFFAYVLGGRIDQLFFPERLPTPTFGTGGVLWASLTLALLTVPVVIVATEEALAAVPGSMREGSLACGASKWQTIKYIVLPRAMPGILTGLILAMARGAGEVAPLMLVGVVKLAPELPVDQFFPYIHLERSFMHLGFHIYDVGFQSRNSEAAKPMVYVTTLLLISLVFAMNGASIVIRNRLKRKFFTGHF